MQESVGDCLKRHPERKGSSSRRQRVVDEMGAPPAERDVDLALRGDQPKGRDEIGGELDV